MLQKIQITEKQSFKPLAELKISFAEYWGFEMNKMIQGAKHS